MPTTANERDLLNTLDFDDNDLHIRHQRRDRAPDDNTKFGRFTIVCLVLNRTIGSGIFFAPQRVLQGTGTIGGALCLWALGALISICGTYVWNECSLGMPQTQIRGELYPRGVPKSGGEKNFVEFMFPDRGLRLPHIRTTCSFAVMFMVLYNLSGNAIAFAQQALTASGHWDPVSGSPPPRGAVIVIAIGVLSLIIVSHSISRKGGIIINDAFAVVKVAFLLVIFFLGVAKAGESGGVATKNFTKDVWTTQRTDVGSWTSSLMLCLYSLSGAEQPFYVIAESKSPRRYYPKYTIFAIVFASFLFMLVNIAYLLVVNKEEVLGEGGRMMYLSQDLATLFFDSVFNESQEKAVRAMAAVIAISIFGNLWVMTFTAARVKQEIAKEGILPWSLFFATSYRTPYGFFQQWRAKSKLKPEHVERAPTAAYLLHWFTSILLVAVKSPISDTRKSYSILVYLYTYSMVMVVGAWVSFGLLKIKIRKKTWHWQERRRYRPWLSPVHVVVYGFSTTFLVIAAFVPPARGSPFYYSVTGLPWYVLPTIGLSAPFWGILWYYGFRLYEHLTEKQLEIIRKPYCVPDPKDPNEYIQQAELFSHWWPNIPRGKLRDEFADSPVHNESQKGASVVSHDFGGGHDGIELESGTFQMPVDNNRRQCGVVEDDRRLSDSFD